MDGVQETSQHATPDYVRLLNNVSRSQINDVGSKAANLGELIKSGFPVPEGYVLTTKAFERFIQANNLVRDSLTPESIQSSQIPQDLKMSLSSMTRTSGDVLGVALLCENDEVFGKRAELISELVGTKNMSTYAVNHPRTAVALTSTDWDIIKTMRPNPLMHYSEVAEKLALSSRTVQRRLQRLIESNALFFVPNIDFSRLEGASCIDVFISYTGSEFKKGIEQSIFTKFKEYALRAGWGSENYGHFEFLIPNVKVAQEIVDYARGLEGVGEVKLYFIFDWLIFFNDTIDEIMRSRIAL